MIWGLLAVAVLIASTLGGLLGFGTAALLLPVLSLALGTRVAVPTLGIAMVFANASRAAFSWKQVDWKVVIAFSSLAVPASLLGAVAYVGLDVRWLNVAIAIFILLVVPVRRIAERAKIEMKLGFFAPLGALFGLVSGIGGVVGPAGAPFLLSYGLIGSSYLGTDGVNSTLIHGAKSIVYWFGGAMTAHDVGLGVLLGAIMVFGSFQGRRLVERINAKSYIVLIEITMLVLGLAMLWQAESSL